VIERAEAAARDDDDRIAEIPRPLADLVLRGEGNAPAAHAFHGQMGKKRGHCADVLVQPNEIDGAVFGLRGEKGRGRFKETGLISSSVRGEPAFCRQSASSRSPVVIGFKAAAASSCASQARTSQQVNQVLPTPVSVPVMKK
jgi:hypothetical protein